jgi:hypothetical protein
MWGGIVGEIDRRTTVRNPSRDPNNAYFTEGFGMKSWRVLLRNRWSNVSETRSTGALLQYLRNDFYGIGLRLAWQSIATPFVPFFPHAATR